MAWIPIAVLIVILRTDLWVYADARKRSERGNPATLSIGALDVNTPAVWFVRHGGEPGGSHLNEIAGPKLEKQGDSVP